MKDGHRPHIPRVELLGKGPRVMKHTPAPEAPERGHWLKSAGDPFYTLLPRPAATAAGAAAHGLTRNPPTPPPPPPPPVGG